MRVSPLAVVVVSACAAVGACDPAARPPGDELPPPPSVAEVRRELEDALLEKLTCDETLRPSTLQRMRAVLEDADDETIGALLLNPQDLASVVALGGAQVEAPVIVARNLLRIFADGTANDVVENGWDGVSCGEAVPLSCTAGEQRSVVDCDADGAATALRLSFDLCTLGGVVYNGAVTLTRLSDVGVVDVGAAEVAALGFDDFTFNEVRRLDGTLLIDVGPVDVGTSADRFVADISDAQRFSFVEHGGLASGLECASETTFATLGLDVDGDSAFVKMGASRADPDVTVGIETFGDHLRFGDPSVCGCPLPGSGALIDVPRPLGRAGETGKARVTWQPSSDATLCSQPRVELVTWPESCDVGESGVDVDGDCARGATEDMLAAALGALCAR